MDIKNERDRLLVRCRSVSAKLRECDPFGTNQELYRIRRASEIWSKLIEGKCSDAALSEIDEGLNAIKETVDSVYAEKWKEKKWSQKVN